MKISERKLWWTIGILALILWTTYVFVWFFPEDPEREELTNRVNLLREETLWLLEENQKILEKLLSELDDLQREEETLKVSQEAVQKMEKLERIIKEKKLRVLGKKELRNEQQWLEKLLPVLKEYNLKFNKIKEEMKKEELKKKQAIAI